MTDKKKLYSEHITAAKDWLGKAEKSIAEDNDIRSDLNLMLAQAELQRAKEKDDRALLKKWLKWLLPWVAAILVAVGYVYFLRPELFNNESEVIPESAVIKEESVSSEKAVPLLEEKKEEPAQNENDIVIPADNAGTAEVYKSDESGKTENAYTERNDEQNTSVQKAEKEQNTLPETDIQKMIQSAGKILRD